MYFAQVSDLNCSFHWKPEHYVAMNFFLSEVYCHEISSFCKLMDVAFFIQEHFMLEQLMEDFSENEIPVIPLLIAFLPSLSTKMSIIILKLTICKLVDSSIHYTPLHLLFCTGICNEFRLTVHSRKC